MKSTGISGAISSTEVPKVIMQIPMILTKRIAYAVFLLIAVLVLNFSLIYLAPGDVVDTIAASMGGADAEHMAQIRTEYGLDRPFIFQLSGYVGRVLSFDLGHSYFYNRPVSALILERLPATLLLVISAQVISLFVGILLGVFSARNPKGFLSHIVTLISLFGYAAPVFWTGILLLIAFSLKIPIFPVAGMQDVTVSGGFFAHSLDVAHHLILPMITLGSIFVALYSRMCRASMLEVLGSDYVRTAKAKGLSQRQIVLKHALKNALPPVVTLAGLQFSAVISGAVLVETVFSWPGLGQLALTSILARDTPTILGILFFSALVVIIGNLLTDLVLRVIDPRVRGQA